MAALAGQLYQCLECHLVVESPQILESHLRSQHGSLMSLGDTRFQCEICDKTFTVLSNLKRHIKTIHEKEKAFTCEICSKSFSQHGNMKRHMKVHRGDAGSVNSDNNDFFSGDIPLSNVSSPDGMVNDEAEFEAMAGEPQADYMMDTPYADSGHVMLTLNVAEAGLQKEASSGGLLPADLQTYPSEVATLDLGNMPSICRDPSSSGGISFEVAPVPFYGDQLVLRPDNSQGSLPGPGLVRSGSSNPPETPDMSASGSSEYTGHM